MDYLCISLLRLNLWDLSTWNSWAADPIENRRSLSASLVHFAYLDSTHVIVVSSYRSDVSCSNMSVDDNTNPSDGNQRVLSTLVRARLIPYGRSKS